VGVDFSIHVITRFQEETSRGAPLDEALATMLGTSGVAVIIGALTTALAFFTLMVGDTKGVHEFGIAAGLGVLLTLVAILMTLPALLTVRHRVRERRGAVETGRVPGDGGYRWIGRIAAAGWNHPGLFLAGTVIVVAGSIWAMRHTEYEYDFLELEEEGLRSVELQREIPRRFGVSDHGAWLVTQTVEESREMKEAFRLLPEVGEVNAVSDFVPSAERIETYAPRLRRFRNETLARDRQAWQPGDGAVLASEVERLWDNLDLMSNLAYTAGLDRIVGVIDQMTGLDAETGETDPRALLPTLARILGDGVPDEVMHPLAEAWAVRLEENLERMTNPAAIALDELPGSALRSFTPKTAGEGFLVHIVPRGYLWDRASLERFASQAEAVRADVVGSEKLMLVMMDETLQDGAEAALLALAVIAALLLFHFRGPIGLVALIPLAIGSLTMLGFMYVFGMKYNYMNLIATPIILGIGIDDGVHVLHRIREHPSLSVTRVAESFQFVGKAILLTSITTMIGFGSVGFYAMRGMASFGQVLCIGVGACFLATVFVLPAVMWVVSGQWRAAARKDVAHAVR
jgi:predicted RND superfamily exporter protein